MDKIKTSLMIQILGLIEKLIPAFFVHWNHQLKKKTERLQIKVKLANYEVDKYKAKDSINEKFSDKSDIDTINDFLSDPKSSGSQPTTKGS